MKPKILLSVIASTMITANATLPAAAPLLYDGFDYPLGNTLGDNNWNLIAASGGAALNVVNHNLSYPGLAPSTGNAVELRPNAQDWFRNYPEQTFTTSDTAFMYYSFLIRVDDLGSLDATGGLFVSLANTSGTAGQAASVWLRTSGSGFQIGVSKRNSNPEFDSSVFAINETIYVVASYNLIAGPINNDTASLWINPGGMGLPDPPAPNLTTPVSGINDDVIDFGTVVLRPQGGAGSTQIPASLILDEVRVGTSWAAITPVPEPSAAALLVLAFCAAGFFRFLRRGKILGGTL